MASKNSGTSKNGGTGRSGSGRPARTGGADASRATAKPAPARAGKPAQARRARDRGPGQATGRAQSQRHAGPDRSSALGAGRLARARDRRSRRVGLYDHRALHRQRHAGPLDQRVSTSSMTTIGRPRRCSSKATTRLWNPTGRRPGPQAYDIALKPGTSPRACIAALGRALGPEFTVSFPDLGAGFSQFADKSLIQLLTVLIAVLARLGVLNSVLMAARGRVHDLGIFKALGMTPTRPSSWSDAGSSPQPLPPPSSPSQQG